MNRLAIVPVFGLVLAVAAAPAPIEDVEALVERLGDKRFRVREEAMKKLVALGPKAVPALQKALESPDLEIRTRAKEVLEAIGTNVEALLAQLKGKNIKARVQAAESLAALGPKGRAAIPELEKLLRSPDAALKEAAATALAGIDPDHKAVAGTTPAKATVGGKYSKLLRKIKVEADRQSYGNHYDYGHYQGTSWAGHQNLPAGHWVYVYPNWYIWGENKTGEAGKGQLEAAPGQRQAAPDEVIRGVAVPDVPPPVVVPKR